MNTNTMRKIDRWLGIPLCFLFSGIHMLFRRFHHVGPGQIKKILFVKLAEQGATVVAYPAILEAAERVGRENVYFIVFKGNHFILEIMDVVPIENILTVPTGSLFATLIGLFRVILQLRKERIDTAVDLEFFARASALICFLTGAKRRVGLHSFAGEAPYRGSLMTHPIPYNCHLHTRETFLILVRAMDVCTSELPALDIPQQSGKHHLKRFRPKQEDAVVLRKLLHKESGRDDLSSTIILNANASDLLPVRRWPVRNYIELGRQLVSKYPKLCIVFTGAPSEAEVADQLAEKVGSDRCISLAGKITFRQLMVLFTMGNLLLTNDSGPAHFATLTNIRVLVLFGPETPALFAPKGPQVHVVWKALACSPCVSALNNRQTKCRSNICMQRISVECVFYEVCKIYEESLNKDLQEMTNEFVIKPQRSMNVQIHELRSHRKE